VTEIYVDADACPVKDEVYRVAARYGLHVIVVANARIGVPHGLGIEVVVVGRELDAADDWIAEHVQRGDVVITSDIPLASRILAAGAHALGSNGRPFTEDSIGSALAMRQLNVDLREMGLGSRGPRAMAPKDRARFLSALDQIVQTSLRRREDSARRGPLEIRPLAPDELDALVRLWNETKRDTYRFIPQERDRTLEEDGAFFRANVLPRCAIWVAAAPDGLLGFLALEGSYVDRLYVHPRAQRRGVGEALLRQALAVSPAGLELHTHQRNHKARAFYRKLGFHPVRYGVSPPPESEPDVELHWRPPEST
jgi:hypothetical protein